MDWKEETERRVEKGVALFKQGYNCSQAVSMALCDLYDVPQDLMARMSASFGGGIGRMRETCGAASGMFLMAGLETGPATADNAAKAHNYEVVQQLAADFKAQTGSLICRELLEGKIRKVNTVPTPDERTEEYYKKRPCVEMVEIAIRTFMQFKVHSA